MTSQVNPNNIDGTYPIAGQDNDSQGFRDNFTNIRNNLTFVKAELEDLQNKAVLTSPLLSGDLNNDFMGNAIVGVALKGWRETINNIGSFSGPVNIDFSLGNYQKLTLTGSATLSFTWPSNLSNQFASIKLWVVVPSSSYTITLPNTVTLGDPDTIAGLSGTNPPIISFTSAEISNNTNYLFEFFTFDAGTTLGIIDHVRNRDVDLSGMSITGSLAVDTVSATGNITTSGNLITTYGVLWAANGAPYFPTPATLSVSGTITSGGNIVAASTTESTSSTVGSFVSLGGIGVAKVATIAGNIVAAATTQSTNSTTGALVVKGGMGVAANVNIDGNLWITSGNIRTTAATANIFNFSGTTVSLGNATAQIFMGVSTGNVNVGGNVIAGANVRASSFVPTSTAIPQLGMYTGGTNIIGFSTANTERWYMNASGSFVPVSDNTVDIGNGTSNPRDIYASRNATITGNVRTSGNLHSTAGRINSGYFYANVVTNQNLFANVNYNVFVANASPHGTVANLRFTLPASAEDGREIMFRTLVPITVCFVSNGAETATTGNTVHWVANTFASAGNVTARFVYNATSSRWMNLG